ncbi:MAG: translocation/assembly module TamB [Balneolales bacterium]|nr:translocation/assembly module TamB [Balneolales bacterium]
MLASLLLGVLLLLLQLNPVQQRIAAFASNEFNAQFEGEIQIGGVSGRLPLDLELSDVFVTYTPYLPDAGQASVADTVLYAKSLYVRLDLRQIIFDRFTVSSIVVQDPDLKFHLREKENGQGYYSFLKAFSRTEPAEIRPVDEGNQSVNVPLLDVRDISIRAGTLQFIGFPEALRKNEQIALGEQLFMQDLTLRAGLDFGTEQRLINVREFKASIPGYEFAEILFRGQVYSDDTFLEFNRFTLRTASSSLIASLSFEGVDLNEPSIADQLMKADASFNIRELILFSDEFTGLFPELPATGRRLTLEASSTMSAGNIVAERLLVEFGESQLMLDGYINNVFENPEFGSKIEFARLHYDDVASLNTELKEFVFTDYNLVVLKGEMSGNTGELMTDLSLSFPGGEIELFAKVSFQEKMGYTFRAEIENLQSDVFPSLAALDFGLANGRIELNGEGTELTTANSSLKTNVRGLSWNNLRAGSLKAEARIYDGFLEPSLVLYDANNPDEAVFQLSGWVDFMRDEPFINLEGTSRNLDPSGLIVSDNVFEGSLNSTFTLTATGANLDRYSGEVYLNILDSSYNSKPIEEFEFFAFLDEPDQDVRKLRIGGTMFEAQIEGDIVPSRLIASVKHWQYEVGEKIRLRSVFDLIEAEEIQIVHLDSLMLNNSLTLSARLDDLRPLNFIFPDFPEIETISNLDLKIESGLDQLKFSMQLFADYMEMDQISVDSLVTRTEILFNRGKRFDFFEGGLEFRFGSMLVAGQEFRNADIYIDAYDEAFVLQRFSSVVGDDVEIGAMISAVFSDRDVDVRIMDFYVGDEEYTWRNIDQTPIRIDNEGRIHVNRLEFGNLQERFIVDGTFSENPDDEVSYLITDLKLDRISSLVNSERVDFSGTMNGTFVTRTIRTDPNFLGDIRIDYLELNDRLIGDLNFRSRFNAEEERFDTRLTIRTDPERYEEYLAANEDIGQDIVIEGFIRNSFEEDEVFASFDVLLNEIDLWILPLIVDGIFEKVEGRAKGSGNIDFRRSGLDFEAEFEVSDIKAVPVFLLAELEMNGNIGLNSREGVIFRDVAVRDQSGGTGILRGAIDLNDFAGETFFDMELEMSGLTFLNNRAGQDVPFFGRGTGTGVVRLSGSNLEPFISTPTPISLSSNSIFSIPISTDESVDGGTRFIQFVENFDDSAIDIANGRQNGSGTRSGQNDDPGDLTFMEKFEFDLQFVSNNNMMVRLIFDEVTNEILSARGTGRIRLQLTDEVFQVFGRFDVAGGDYLFVGGDIFSRRFIIREGGTIEWDGDPVNARINVQAAYRARPDINLLRPGSTGDEAPVRVPVDLILAITGTLDSIENDFYFEFPSGTDVAETAGIMAQLETQDTKLLQATSVLLTGNFTNTGINNLFASQIGAQGLSTLLSAQISGLLNANISNLDVDLSLTGFDEADLSIALRLFDDRLTLRREGTVISRDAASVAGNNYLGDIDLTYRINRYLSVEIFHRRESMLPSAAVITQQSDESYGVGLEARVQFNTWQELKNRVWGAVRRLFGSADEPEEPASVAVRDEE